MSCSLITQRATITSVGRQKQTPQTRISCNSICYLAILDMTGTYNTHLWLIWTFQTAGPPIHYSLESLLCKDEEKPHARVNIIHLHTVHTCICMLLFRTRQELHTLTEIRPMLQYNCTHVRPVCVVVRDHRRILTVHILCGLMNIR